MTALQYDKLFAPYTTDGHTLERTLKYLAKIAVQGNIPTDVLEIAMNEIFAEVANGRVFPKDKCPCGCGIDKAATALIHAIRDRMLAIDTANTMAAKKLMQRRYQTLITGEMKRISKTDKQFVKMNRPPLKERSPVLRTVRKIWDLIFLQ